MRRAAIGVLPFALGVTGVGCSGDSPTSETAASADSTAPPTTALPSCAESRHLAVFDFFGFLSMDDQDLRAWMDDPTTPPAARPGTAEAVNAYRSLGYEVAYLTTVPVNLQIGEQPIDDAIRGWLADNGFPGGEGTSIMTWDAGGDPIISITNQLLRFAGQDVSVDIGYSDNQDKAYAIITGGVPADHMYTIGSGAGTEGSRAIPNNDVTAHAGNVEGLDPVCQPGTAPAAATGETDATGETGEATTTTAAPAG